MTDQPVIGVDLGGTKIAAALSWTPGEVAAFAVLPTEPEKGVEAVVGRIRQAAEQVAAAAGVAMCDVAGIGLGSPGPVNRHGLVILAPNLGWHGVPVGGLVAAALARPVVVGNDANLAGLAEVRCGAARGRRDVLYMTVSTGIGGGILVDGEIYDGADGCAGEFGHICIMRDGPICNCGRRGCLEALASGPAMARRAAAAVQAGRHSLLTQLCDSDPRAITAAMVGEAARQGDPLAQETLVETGEYLGNGLADLVSIFNPEMVVIGGGVANLGDMLLAPVRARVRAVALPPAAETVQVVAAALGAKAGVIGATLLAAGSFLPKKGRDELP